MVDVKELRIGNNVYCGTDEHDKPLLCYVVGIRENMVYWTTDEHLKDGYNKTGIEYAKPIPLSNELLIKFGFEKNHLSQVYTMTIKYADENYPCTLQRTGDGIQICRSGIGAITAHIFYLHQLQNLYFALTQKELTINTIIK